MKCKCQICGYDDAGKIRRGSYIRANIITAEEKSYGATKVAERRLRRRREKREWRAESLAA